MLRNQQVHRHTGLTHTGRERDRQEDDGQQKRGGSWRGTSRSATGSGERQSRTERRLAESLRSSFCERRERKTEREESLLVDLEALLGQTTTRSSRGSMAHIPNTPK